jgi:membrane associated rhomboid family serine protease
MLPLRDNAPRGAEPVVNYSLLLICVTVFIMQLLFPGGFEHSLYVWGEVPTRILSGGVVPGTTLPAWVTWLSSMFMHGGVEHLAGNMIMLWLFGDNVEWLLGRFRYIVFYLLCGLLANVATTLIGYQGDQPGIGASGAIAGVMAAYMLVYPRARVTSLLWITPFSFMHMGTGQWGFVLRNISALWYIGGWIALQLVLGGLLVVSEVHVNAGIYAHVAGAAVGAAMCPLLVIAARRPEPDHAVVTDELTAAVWGDEGDGGSGGSEALSLAEEAHRIRMARTDQLLEESFKDYVVEELAAKGDLKGALAHCREMRDIAVRRDDQHRVKGYDRLIDGLEEQLTPALARGAPASHHTGWG